MDSNTITESVIERGLVKEKVKVKEILDNYNLPCKKSCAKTKIFNSGASLAYVTPWNGKGYDIAKWYTQKFTHISPVWLQLKFQKGLHLDFHGTHDIDEGWLAALRKNKNVKLVPRVLFDGWSAKDYKRAYASEDAMAMVAKIMGDFAVSKNFDGFVLEVSWMTPPPSQRDDLLHLLVHIGDHLHSIDKQFLLVVPPAPPAVTGATAPFTNDDFEVLKDSVDFFSLMTYDYPMRPGPTAPIDWVEHCIKIIVPGDDAVARSKILTGLNFYGYKYGSHSADAILGSQLIEKLEKAPEKFKISWLTEFKEHKFTEKKSNNVIYFPTLASINERLKLFKAMKTGLSIWEIGQGLDYFYDLL